jgi:hypothetical protein
MNIAVNIDIIKGILLGIRHFDPEEYAPYYEVQFYLLVKTFFENILSNNLDNQ